MFANAEKSLVFNRLNEIDSLIYEKNGFSFFDKNSSAFLVIDKVNGVHGSNVKMYLIPDNFSNECHYLSISLEEDGISDVSDYSWLKPDSFKKMNDFKQEVINYENRFFIQGKSLDLDAKYMSHKIMVLMDKGEMIFGVLVIGNHRILYEEGNSNFPSKNVIDSMFK